VIQGGSSSESSQAVSVAPVRVVGAATAHALAEEERLRQLILRTKLPNKAKANVETALRELSELDGNTSTSAPKGSKPRSGVKAVSSLEAQLSLCRFAAVLAALAQTSL